MSRNGDLEPEDWRNDPELPDYVKAAFEEDWAREQREKQQKRNGNGLYQGRNGLAQHKPVPALGWWRDRVRELRPLCDKVFPPLQYVVPHLVPEGVSLLCGRPKLKKSFLALQIACAVANGDITLIAGNGEPPPHGDVLYLALEDNERRIQDRVTTWFGLNKITWPDNFLYALEWLPLHAGGADGIGEWCLSVSNPKLVVIDTLQRVRAPKQFGETDYQADMEAAAPLIRICGQHPGLSIICLHHDRKMGADDPFDTISGTLGMSGGVDTMIVLKRAGGNVTMHIRGRDLKEEIEKAIKFDEETCRWHILGEAKAVHQSDTRKAILELLQASGSMTPRELADQMDGLTTAGAKTALWRLAREGVLESNRGAYRIRATGYTVDP